MNLVGKILTVVIFALSLLFMAFAMAVYETHTNWRLVADNPSPKAGEPKGLKQQFEAEQQVNTELRAKYEKEKQTWDEEKAARAQSQAKLETENAEFKRERDDERTKREELDKQLREAVQQVKTSHDILTNLRTEVEGLRKDIRQAQQERDDHFKRMVEVTDQLQQSENERTRLDDLNKKLSGQYASALEVLRMHKLKPEPQLYAKEAPPVGGKVVAVSGEGAVEVSLGADDGLLRGHQLDVYRTSGSTNVYVGRIEVMRTSPDRAVCKVLPNYMKSGVREGDRVISKLELQ